MGSKIFFLRHAATLVDLSTLAKNWDLSHEGNQMSLEISLSPLFPNVKHIFCSTEQKTYSTIAPFAKQNRIPIQIDAGFNEIHFNGLPFSDPEQFRDLKYQCFQNLDKSFSDSETFREGLDRFKKTLSDIQRKHSSEDILIVTHGTILTLFFADLLQILNDGDKIFERWQKLPFGAWGSIESGLILQDLSSHRME